ncbi:MAG: FAD-dependent oxidoreductase [Patescibacteria group bacterium]
MRCAILGGGFAGLAAAYYAQKKGWKVTVLEKEAFLGGLAAGFRADGWDWYLERAYHHLFTNDTDILSFADEISFTDISTLHPQTASLYQIEGELRTLKLDAPTDLLTFPLLSLPERLRVGVILAFFKATPFLSVYEKQTAETFLRTYMGSSGWEHLFAELFRKKFGKFAEKILASFIWARVNKRTKDLAYVNGGFQNMLNHLENLLSKQGVEIIKSTTVREIRKKSGIFAVKKVCGNKTSEELFDRVICTLPTPIIPRITQHLLTKEELDSMGKIEYLAAMNMILESDEPLLDETYWLSVCVREFPMMVLVQHTNMVAPSHFGGRHILYVGNYLEQQDPRMKQADGQLIDGIAPYLDKIRPGFMEQVTRSFVFKAPLAQPIFNQSFLQHVPGFTTSVDGLYVANLDMTYPYDRGTNYAVKLGRTVSEMLQ